MRSLISPQRNPFLVRLGHVTYHGDPTRLGVCLIFTPQLPRRTEAIFAPISGVPYRAFRTTGRRTTGKPQVLKTGYLQIPTVSKSIFSLTFQNILSFTQQMGSGICEVLTSTFQSILTDLQGRRIWGSVAATSAGTSN